MLEAGTLSTRSEPPITTIIALCSAGHSHAAPPERRNETQAIVGDDYLLYQGS